MRERRRSTDERNNMSKLSPHMKLAISLMAPDRRNRRCDHVLARIPHCDAGVFEKVAQGSVADEPEAARCELRATTEQSVFAILWQHMEISLAMTRIRARASRPT